MIPNHIVMIANAVILIALGVAGYFGSEVKSFTAFIGPAIGVLLFVLAFPTKKENHIAAHIAVVITLLSAIAIIARGISSGNALVLIMGVATVTAFIFYVANFFIRKKLREETK
jgi:hypothetical protein